jgi:serine/threonine protein kinase/tetratricopeptide (TPR) repeat protein
MTAERWRLVKSIFNGALELDPPSRPKYVEERCRSDLELKTEVDRLLLADAGADSLLDRPMIPEGSWQPESPALKFDLTGRTIGNYIFCAEIARGGMGIVYEGRHTALPRKVVIKCIRPHAYTGAGHDELRERFRREAHIQSQIDHPKIVRVYEFFAGDEEYFLVMEHVPGSNLREMLERQGALPADRAIDLAVQALDGLAYAHTLCYVDETGNSGIGVIHRDIKPANLLVDEHGNLKLTDFGIAKVIGEKQLTKAGPSPGTVEYMSPEQIRGLPVDARCDIYSLGVTLYEALTGHVPFERALFDSDYDVLKAHVETDPPPMDSANSAIPAQLADVVMQSLRKDPEERWQSAADFRDALAALQDRQPQGSVPRPSTQIPAARKRYRPFVVAGMAALALIAAISTTSVYWTGRSAQSNVQPSIAVLPFVSLSSGTDQEYFSDGLAEELMGDLSRIPGLRVAGRTSSYQFKGKTADFSTIGKRLNVATILEGNVRKQGNRVKVSLNLIKTSDGFLLWSQNYDREITDVFAMEEEIGRAVSGALRVPLMGTKSVPSAPRTNSADAYNADLKGRYLMTGRNQDRLEKAVNYFDQATKLDPNFAPAWVGLADARNAQASAEYIEVNDGYRMAREAVDRALTLDPNLAEAQAVLGVIKMAYGGDWAGAKACFRRALDTEPGNLKVLRSSASLEFFSAHFDQAIGLCKRALEVDPLNAGTYKNIGIYYDYAGRQEEAIAAFTQALELSPLQHDSHTLLALVLLEQGRLQDALAEINKENNAYFQLMGYSLVYHALGQRRESNAKLAELIAKHSTEASYQIAEVYAFRGELDKAFEWLDRADRDHDLGIREMRGDPLLKKLTSDPRYGALVTRLKLPL